jgi:hypothetical protein
MLIFVSWIMMIQSRFFINLFKLLLCLSTHFFSSVDAGDEKSVSIILDILNSLLLVSRSILRLYRLTSWLTGRL